MPSIFQADRLEGGARNHPGGNVRVTVSIRGMAGLSYQAFVTQWGSVGLVDRAPARTLDTLSSPRLAH